jgi:hypothetical protein
LGLVTRWPRGGDGRSANEAHGVYNFQDKRNWYGVAAVIVALIII